MAEPLSQADQLREKVASLATLILEKHPTMPKLLHEIHSTVRKYPEQVTILSEEEIEIIFSGLQVQTGVEFATTAQKSGNKSAISKIKSQGVDAF